MNIIQVANELTDFSSKDKFDVKLESVNDEFCELSFNSLDKKQKSYTLLILPQAKILKDKGVKV